VLTSKNEAKSEARFAARLDVLMERMDTLAATVATTASAMAQKDGEIANLRRDLEARDETLAALAARIQGTPSAPDGRELRELREAVATLSAGRSKDNNPKQIEELIDKVGLLGQRLETLSTTVSTTAAGLAGREGELAIIRKRLESTDGSPTLSGEPDPAIHAQLDELASKAAGANERLDAQASELATLRGQLERRDAEQQAPADELRAMLTTLRSRVESLDGLRAGVTEDELDERLAETNEALSHVAERIDVLAESVEAATGGLGDKEHELAALHRHFMESSARVETIVEDLKEALAAFPDAGPEALSALGSRIDATASGLTALTSRLERLESARLDARAGDLAEHIDRLEGRVSTLADELARAKTLWPVALRSLEARLDDVARRPADHPPAAAPSSQATGDDPDDLLAGLRDSLHAMESVAAELERASEARTEGDTPSIDEPVESDVEPDEDDVEEAVAGGARIVPLRQSDP
jgi:DNA repair exonuclease SbcCD ATPase subunit